MVWLKNTVRNIYAVLLIFLICSNAQCMNSKTEKNQTQLSCKITWLDDSDTARLLQPNKFSEFARKVKNTTDAMSAAAYISLALMTLLLRNGERIERSKRCNKKCCNRCNGSGCNNCCDNYCYSRPYYGNTYIINQNESSPSINAQKITLENLTESVIPVKINITNNSNTACLAPKTKIIAGLAESSIPFKEILRLYPTLSSQKSTLIWSLIFAGLLLTGTGLFAVCCHSLLYSALLQCSGLISCGFNWLLGTSGAGAAVFASVETLSCLNHLEELGYLRNTFTNLKNSIIIAHDINTGKQIPLVDENSIDSESCYRIPPHSTIETIVFINRGEWNKFKLMVQAIGTDEKIQTMLPPETISSYSKNIDGIVIA